MPVRFDVLTSRCADPALQNALVRPGPGQEGQFFSQDGRFCHIRRPVRDEKAGETAGALVYTLACDLKTEQFRLLDLDYMPVSTKRTKLTFLSCLSGSSDANEYWFVAVPGTGQRFEVETVDRRTVPGPLEGADRAVYLAAFPFEVSFYDSLADFNRQMEAPGSGFDLSFTAPGSAFAPDRGPHAMLLGTVKSVRDVTLTLGGVTFTYAVAQVKTGAGLLPAVLGRDVFDLSGLSPGRVMWMSANVKADLAADGDFRWLTPEG